MNMTPERLIEVLANTCKKPNANAGVGLPGWPPGVAPPYTIAISRQAGASGAEVAQAVGNRLGWPVYDRELLQRVAEEMGLRANHLEGVDEKTKSWLEEALVALAAGRYMVSDISYARHLLETLFAIAAQGECVIVGRGAAQVLPASTTLRVRMVAELDDRIAKMRRSKGFTQAEARRWVEKTDVERAAFVREHFQKESDDPMLYDLALNSSHFTVPECADMIIAGLHAFQARSRAAAPVHAVV